MRKQELKNIGGLHSEQGYQFTLSFHVHSRGDVRVYLFRAGAVVRFFLQDLFTILPHYFYGDVLKNYENDVRIEQLKRKIKRVMKEKATMDEKFPSFYESLTGFQLF